MDASDDVPPDSPRHWVILREAYQCDTMSQMLAERQKRLQRNELARFYHWKQRKRLTPLNIHKRQF
jgi:hypothetical protein